ncbi:hypothetical protein [Gloeothece verrucosa]|uniref:Uncharacterized protein n=1 Tax=Gloeothece verrucosa (strain PCC 7822) TaxID=497965 RepID=E0UMQ1_GLOV7|nr:hypothetical protein [Gloeothece verrucosa]ADN18231.1 hypothetical protein Cyan7822_6448 [Gloeothece verrucosa PCC 7822]
MDFTTSILSVILFVVYFCFISVLLYKEQDAVEPECQQTFSYEDAFSPEYDREPEVAVEMPLPSQQLCLPAAAVRRHNQVQPIANDVIIPIARQELYLPAASVRRHNEVEAIANATIITPVPTQPEIPAQPNIPPLPEKRTVTQLRKFIKEHNLQAVVKEKVGKTYSKCNQQELLSVLEA